MNETESKATAEHRIRAGIRAFANGPLAENSRELLRILGYSSDKTISLVPNDANTFEHTFVREQKFDRLRAHIADWQSVDLLFQLTEDEVRSTYSQASLLFDARRAIDPSRIESYLFFAIQLKYDKYTRTELADITREVNRIFPMPAMLILKHGTTLSISIIDRRLNLRDPSKDVVDKRKVSLIKDIEYSDPIRAHLDILYDFAFNNLDADFGVSNFVRLHEAWRKRLDSYKLSEDFYREIADWYLYAHHMIDDGQIRLPPHCDTEQEKSLFLIRLLTRVIFCWFLVEKALIPGSLFNEDYVATLIREYTPNNDPTWPDTSTSYYHAILQNLFFGTLNTPQGERRFRAKKTGNQFYDNDYADTSLWHYEDSFRHKPDWPAVAELIPFLNGGLFDCLDDKIDKKSTKYILDGFSDNPHHSCHLPNDLHLPLKAITLPEESDHAAARKRSAFRQDSGILFALNGLFNFRLRSFKSVSNCRVYFW